MPNETDDYFPEEPKPATPAVEEKPGKKKKHSTIDGPRYTVGLRSDTDPCCYKDFFETEKLSEAKEEAEKAVAKYSKGVIIFDRIGCPGIIERFEPPQGQEPMVVGKVTPETKKGKKKSK